MISTRLLVAPPPVRALAERSSSAAKEIDLLINEMTTEVDLSGVAVDAAGKTIVARLLRNHCKATSLIACTRSLHGSIQRKQVCLGGNAFDDRRDFTDTCRTLRECAHALGRILGRAVAVGSFPL